MLINRSGSVVLFFITLYLTKELDYSVENAGQLVSLYGLGAMGGAFLGGWATDRWGVNKVQIVTLLFSSVGFLWLSFLTTAFSIGLMLFFIALTGEAFRPANSAAVAKYTPADKRARGFGLNRLAINFGVAIGPAVGGFLATINYSFIFWMDAITCFIAAIALWVFFRNDLGNESQSHNEDTSEAAGAVKSPWGDKLFFYLLLLLFFSGVVFNQLFNTWPLYLREVNLFSEDSIGLLMALNAIMIVLIEMPVLHRLEVVNPVRIMTIGILLLVGGFALTPFGASWIYIAFTVSIWTMGEIFLFPISASYISNRATDSNRGSYMGFFTFAFALSFVIGPLLGTWAYQNISPNSVWAGCAILCVVITIGFLIFGHLDKKEIARKAKLPTA